MYALPIYSKLVVALLDRYAAGDAARAGIVAAKMSAVWPDLRSAYVQEIAAAGGIPSGTVFPQSLPTTWSGTNRQIGLIALQRWGTAQIAQAIDPLFDAPDSQISSLARPVLALLPDGSAGKSYVRSVSGASVSSLPQILDALIAGTEAESALPPSPAPPATPAPTRTTTTTPRSSTPIQLPPTTITASAPVARPVTWPWYALGGAIAIGIGVYAVQKIRGKT